MSRIRSAALAAAALLAMPTMALAQSNQSKDTRFGPVSVSQNTLLVRGRPVTPSVMGEAGLVLDQVVQVGSYDAVVVESLLGGNGCPAMWNVVSVTAQGATVSKTFGTCSESADVSRKGDGVSLRMPTISTLAQQRAGKGDAGQMHVFVVTDGVVTDNGRPVR